MCVVAVDVSLSRYGSHRLGPQLPSVLLPRQTAATWPPAPSADAGPTAVVLLFTDRDSSSPLYKALAFKYGPARLRFAEVHVSDGDLKARFAVDKYPTMLVALTDKARSSTSRTNDSHE